jgi:type IV pilus assembly protein PilW
MNTMRLSKGFSLTELMVAMVLGLIVVGGVIGVFITNQNTSRFNNTLIDIQQISRHGFQLMARDIRSAGFSGCGNVDRFMNVLNVAGAQPWATWNGGLLGLQAPVAAINGLAPTANTDAIRVMYSGGQSNGVTSHVPPQFTLNSAPTFRVGDIAAVCDDTLTSIFEVSAIAGTTVNHAIAGTINCSTNLGFISPLNCGAVPARTFMSNAMIMRFESVAWFVAPSQDDAAVTSLYRASLVGNTQVNEEVLFGISGLNLLYLDATTRQLRTANAVTNWGDIIAVQVNMTIHDALLGQVAVPANVRTMGFTVTLRNRV